MKKFIDKLCTSPLTFMAVLAVITNICIEVLSRNSLESLFTYITHTPLTFIFNTAIIMLTMSMALFFKRRIFITAFITLIWIVLGIANKFMLVAGNMPLTIFHIANLGSAIKLSSVYMTIFETVILLIGIIAAIIGGCILWKKCPKVRRNLKKATVSLCSLSVICSIMGFTASAQTQDFSDLPTAYEKYGFPYCFSYSVLNMGIAMPERYGPEEVSVIMDEINVPNTEAEMKPNIIFVQLESFFDVKTLTNTNFSCDPVPNFTKLKEEYPSGYFTVSSIGGGTSNTEFEVMTGISLDHFGIGEYPYLTFLSENTCETIMRNLSEYGYVSTAIHSYTGTFYQRHEVFKNLGFDRFVSEEFMTIPQRNPLGWAKDTAFLPYIREAITSTENPDFVYAITVQAHGKYMTEETDGQYLINSDIKNSDLKPQMDYYVNQIKEVDDFIGELTKEYSNFEEPTVIVFFGDHLPALEIKTEDLACGDVYKTEYVIWSNFGLTAEDKDLDADKLSAHVTSILGITNGTLNKLNVYCGERADYPKMAKMLAYDIIYGENFANITRYKPSPMKMGLGLIEIYTCYFEDKNLIIKGKHFNEFSKVTVDGGVRNDTVFIDSETLMIPNLFTFSDTVISVAQVSTDGTILGQTELLICKEHNPIKNLFDNINYR